MLGEDVSKRELALDLWPREPEPWWQGLEREVVAPERPGARPGDEELLQAALSLLSEGRPEAADRLLTVGTMTSPGNDRLWLAAGVCRLRRGAGRGAAQALRMCAWLGDEPLARELLDLCEAG